MKHIASLDGVRATSILMVVAGHQLPLGPSDWQLNSVSATGGMSLFFCLSGFLVVNIIVGGESVQNFLIRRFLRIVPALWLYLAVALIVLQFSTDIYFLNALFVSNYLHAGLIPHATSHLWSLAVEAHFYLGVALLVSSFGARGLILVAPLAAFVTGMRGYYDVFSNIQTHFRVDEILAGAVLGLVWCKSPASNLARRKLRRRESIFGWLLLTIIVLLWLLSSHKESGMFGLVRPYFAASIVAIFLYFRLPVLSPIMESRFASYIAKISYALYLYHPLTIHGWMDIGTNAERYLVKRPFSFAIAWAAAHLSTFDRAGESVYGTRVVHFHPV